MGAGPEQVRSIARGVAREQSGRALIQVVEGASSSDRYYLTSKHLMNTEASMTSESPSSSN